MDTESLRIYLSASPQARELIAQLQCDLSCALDYVRELERALSAADSKSAPAASETAHLVHMPRALILRIACEALDVGRSVCVTLEDGTVQVTRMQCVDHDDTELPIRFVSDGTPGSLTWEALACDRADDDPYVPGQAACVSRLELV